MRSVQLSLSDHLTRAKRAVLEATGMGDERSSRYPEQHVSHTTDKERARSLVDEVHGVAAQIRQAEEEEHHLHYHPADSIPSTKDIDRAARRLNGERGVWDRLLDWTGARRLLPHGMAGDGEGDGVDRDEYFREEAAKKKPVVYEEETADRKKAGLSNSLKAELQQLKERFQHFLHQAQDAIKNRLATPFHDKAASHKTQATDSQQTTETKTTATPTSTHSHDKGDDGAAAGTVAGNESNESMSSSLLHPRPDHPLLDPLHDILRNVDSMTTTPLLPAPPQPEGWWQRFMSTVFPSHLEEHANGMYAHAREEARQEAVKLREAMRGQYDDITRQLKEIKADVMEGKGEPLELYEQYNPEVVPPHKQPGKPSGTAA